MNKLKQTIGLVLLIVWVALIILLISEPTTTKISNVPEYVGWIYIILLIGIPILLVNLLPKAKH